ncbi:MAG: PhnA domain-containing protein [Candidatus Methylumidiphilus sp.]
MPKLRVFKAFASLIRFSRQTLCNISHSRESFKMGTKVKGIRIAGGDHEVDCKMEAGSFMLKAIYLKKV